MTLHDVDIFNEEFIFGGENGHNGTGLTLVLTQDNDDFVITLEFPYSTSGASEIIVI